MKYIRTFKQHKSPKINEGWLADKMTEWDNDIKDVMVSFVSPFKDLIKKISDWKTITDPEKVKIDIQNTMDSAFNSLESGIDKVEKSETLIRLYDDIDQVIVHLNDVFNKELSSLKESVESTASGLKLVIGGIFDTFKDKFRELKSDYLDKLLENDEIDDKRQEAKSFFKDFYNKAKTDMKSVNVDTLMSKGENSFKGIDEVNKDLDLNADDKVRYSMKDDEENIAFVTNNQDVVDDNMVKLRSEDGNETFTINKNQIIEIVGEKEDNEVTKNSILSNIDKIGNDEDKLRKTKNFINKLNEE